MYDSRRYGAVVIGSGQGGTPLAAARAAKGARTALIERPKGPDPRGSCLYTFVSSRKTP